MLCRTLSSTKTRKLGLFFFCLPKKQMNNKTKTFQNAPSGEEKGKKSYGKTSFFLSLSWVKEAVTEYFFHGNRGKSCVC